MTEPRSLFVTREEVGWTPAAVFFFLESHPVKVKDEGHQPLCGSSFTFQPFEFFLSFLSPFSLYLYIL